MAPSSTWLGWSGWSGFRASPYDNGGSPKKCIFWNLLTYQLIARDSRSGRYGPNPLESLPIFYLLSSSCCEMMSLVHPEWVWQKSVDRLCSLLLHQKRSPWRVSRLLLFCYMNSCCRPLYCVPRRWICCRDGEVLSPGLLWKTAQAWLRVIPSFLQQLLWIRPIFSWPLLAQSCYLPNISWVLAEK